MANSVLARYQMQHKMFYELWTWCYKRVWLIGGAACQMEQMWCSRYSDGYKMCAAIALLRRQLYINKIVAFSFNVLKIQPTSQRCRHSIPQTAAILYGTVEQQGISLELMFQRGGLFSSTLHVYRNSSTGSVCGAHSVPMSTCLLVVICLLTLRTNS